MPQRFIFAVGAALFYTMYNVSAKIAGENFEPLVGVVVVNGIVFLVGLLLALYLRYDFGPIFSSDKSWIIFVGAILTVFAEWLYFRMFAYQGGLSSGGIVVSILITIIFALVGWLIFKESFSYINLLGVALALSGVILITLF